MSLPVQYTTSSLMQMTLSAIGSISTLNSSLMLHHAGMAEAFINAKLAKRYTTPVLGDIPILTTLATDLSIYNVLTTRITLKTREDEHPWFQRFKNSLKLLDEIADGDIPLTTSSGTVIDERTSSSDIGEVYSNNMNYVPTFYEGNFEDFVQDQDKLDTELDRR